MEVLRVPPYPITATYDVPQAGFQYSVVIQDKDRNDVLAEYLVESTSGSKLVIELDSTFSNYDDSYYLLVTGESDNDIIIEDNLEIRRPYVNPNTLGANATEIAEYAYYERIARTVIDSITGGFYYKLDWLEATGQGTDYLPLWEKTYKVLRAYENSALAYDISGDTHVIYEWSYGITKDKSAIIKFETNGTGTNNRSEQRGLNIRVSPSDSFNIYDTDYTENAYTFSTGSSFPEGWDYTFLVEAGYKVVPHDIYEATKMLIEDIKCGKIDYYKRYVTAYNTDQFRIQFDKTILDGTGNMLVDKILNKYKKSITKIGIL